MVFDFQKKTGIEAIDFNVELKQGGGEWIAQKIIYSLCFF